MSLILALLFILSPPPAPRLPPEPAPSTQQQFVIDAATDVRLDGRPCPFADVPGDAVMVEMNTRPDGRTITRLWFRSATTPERGR